MGAVVDANTAELFKEKYEKDVLVAYGKEGIAASELSVIDEMVILHTEIGHQIPIARGDDVYVDWIDRYNLGEEVYKAWDMLERFDDDEFRMEE